jgi:peptidyl-prolyl cis-trans isomerase C
MRFNSKCCRAALIASMVGAAAAAAGSAPGDKPLVVNGDLSLTTLDFDAYMQRIPAGKRDEFRAEFEKINPTVDGLWLRRVMAARARAMGLDSDPLVQARIRLAAEDILAEVYILDVAKNAKTPDLEPRARELYKTHLKDFTSPELLTGQHILVSLKSYPPEVARQRAQEIYERARKGEDFAKLAQQYTDNKDSIDINGMPAASFVPPLPATIAKLKPGEISAPVETQYGFHIVKLGERIPPRVKPFEEVRDDLIAMEKQKFIDEEKTAAVEAIRADPKTTLHLENVRALKSDFKMPTSEEIAKIKPNIRY